MTAAYRTVLHRFYRASRRHALGRASTLRAKGGAPLDILVEDVSATGCRLSGAPELGAHETVLIGLAGLGARPARVVWAQDGQAGCHFDAPLSAAELERTQQAGVVVVTGLFPQRQAAAAEPGPEDASTLPSGIRLAIIGVAALSSWALLALAVFVGHYLLTR